MSNLIIVESPTKVHTIKRYLNGEYEVVASMGHLRDLPKSKLGVDIENNFEPCYINIKTKEELISKIKALSKKCDKVFLATDPDREGEAISWHLANMLKLDLNEKNRVTFNEMTKSGIELGMSSPRQIDIDLVNAQQARRILDRIVGYKLSPFLWKKVRRGLSAGRVQSVAVKMIVDRENEINSFVPEEYWSVDAMFMPKNSKKAFSAKLLSVDGEKLESLDKLHADEILNRLENSEYIVSNLKKSVYKKSPAAPFTTSTMQQEASKRLGFISKRTMKVAQELYEGVEVSGLGAVGLITYMRTDSLRISDEAKSMASEFIREKYGEKYLPSKPRSFKVNGNAQDAHEAIRPTMPKLTPSEVKNSLTTDQYKLYKLIWERFIASQMENCLLDTIAVDIEADGCVFRANGNTVKFDGFTVLYEETKDDSEEKANNIPPLEKNEKLNLKSLNANQHFTQPPARYTEATLIKAFEENGIGRPSTYAPTITTILQRSYIERDGKHLKPTSIGEVTTNLMSDYFQDIVDVKFTAEMEKSLDDVEIGKKSWTKTLDEFYSEFDKTLKNAEEAMNGKRVKIPDEETDKVCPECGKKLVIKIGKFGKFLACSGFPDCKHTEKIIQETGGCCPFCGGKVLAKKSKKGKKYFGCINNPKCSFMTWDTPTSNKCPNCSSSLFQKGGKSGVYVCHKQGCGFTKDVKDYEQG